MKKKFSKIISFAVTFIMILTLTDLQFLVVKAHAESKAKYTVMVYECGTDLESREDENGELAGAITNDLNEMKEVGSTENLNILVETGGTKKWKTPGITTDEMRWVVKKGDMELKDNLGPKNMGAYETLKDFIVWGMNNYPAEKYVLILGDHGGGSHGGICVDELNDGDVLQLEEIQKALKEACDAAMCKLELFGCDACLMATLETAYVVEPYASYFVGSEETEPGHGWNYTGFLNKILENPDMNGANLGKAICETYLAQASDPQWDDAKECTLSCIDLSKVNDAFSALDSLLTKANGDINTSEGFNRFASARRDSEDYGNSGGAHGGSTDMVDIVDLAVNLKNAGAYTDDAQNLIDNVSSAVVYALPGCDTKPNAKGLTIYIPCKDMESVSDKTERILAIPGLSQTYKDFVEAFGEKMNGMKNDKVELTDMSPKADNQEASGFIPGSMTASIGTPLPPLAADAEEDEKYQITINKEDIPRVAYVYSVLGKYAEGSDSKVIFLGMDNNVIFDKTTGMVTDDFQGTWVTMEGNFLPMDIEQETSSTILFSTYCKLNGEEVNIKILYKKTTGTYEVMGAYRDIDPKTGMADKNVIKVKKGDEITPIYETYDFNGDVEGYEEGAAFAVVNDKPVVKAEDLPEAMYLYGFYIEDLAGNASYSEFTDLEYGDVPAKATGLKVITASDYNKTAIEISRTGWPGGASTVIIARNDVDSFADALAGAPLAKKYGAPVLFTETASLSADTKSEIQRLKPGKVFILGGPGAVSETVRQQLESMGLLVERIGGADRYETAALIAGKLAKLGCSGKAVIVNAWNYPDALAISPWAANNGAPILLTDTDELPAATKAALEKLQVTETYVAGGTGVVSANVFNMLKGAKRYAGIGRYETGIDIVSKLFSGNDTIYVATGEDYHDALAASAMAAESGSPVILVNNDYALPVIEGYLKSISGKVKTIYIVNTKDAINSSTCDIIKNIVIK